ncbi:MAG: phosphoenolpyruvate synthase [Candidatus Kapabacteria bacterium]|nr:phosphoenolpyruvate synthase [Candidatus Kapabacteria bacterium]
MAIGFSTKAGTLQSLQGILSAAVIADVCCINVSQWNSGKHAVIDRVNSQFGSQRLIVRSSCLREDGAHASNAGAYLSVANVSEDQLPEAIDRVIASYGEADPSDEVLIQPMLRNVILSGVAFSHDPNTCAPYRVVNWNEGADTAVVTGGSGGLVWQQAAAAQVEVPGPIARVVLLLEELLELFGHVPVDCEFAFTREGDEELLWLLQARPLVLHESAEDDAAQSKRLTQIEKQIARGMQPHPFLMGRRTVYGVMPDWNPAEIVGIRPKPLALSLYRDLVTDAIWAYQRHNYGYRNLRSFPLMPHFFGQPYIDVRLSFNSFIPADLDVGVAGRLVDYYIDRLLAEPTLHDKVEFEIVYSCYTLDLPSRLEVLSEAGFGRDERLAIADSLRRLTNRIVHPDNGLWRSDADKLNTLQQRREQLFASNADTLERIYWLLEDAKRYGTLPFAGLARAGFVAIQLLKSLVAVGVFSQSDYDRFLAGVSTVSGQLATDRSAMDKSTFLARYGHLRPGTYDIQSPRYDEQPDLYFDWNAPRTAHADVEPFTLSLGQMRDIAGLLREHGLEPDAVELLNFMQSGIELRELAKFHFTRNLSDALSLITKVGADYGFDRSELAFCDITVFRELHVAASNPTELLRRSIDQGKMLFAESQRLSLPPLIAKPEDVWAFEWPETSPNFITQRDVTAHVVGSDDHRALAGAIVCIPSADPGFDWLFSHPIAGLITAWGGANSHMAIRAGELGLPAVIGAGELLYKKWSSASRLHIDCAARRVEVLS